LLLVIVLAHQRGAQLADFGDVTVASKVSDLRL
jgi:hypothetical protein